LTVVGTPNRRGPDWQPSTRKWRDAWPGNDLAVTHGAWSDAKVRPIAEDLERRLLSAAPWCAQDAFAPTVGAWSWAEGQASLLRAYVDEHGMLDADGLPRPACSLLHQVEVRAARLRSELGLSPNAWAKLVARLGSADHEAAGRGLEHLKSVGAELARTAALPSAEEVEK
jgi:hypothetical protein